MATGSVSIAARLLELQIVGSALFVFNIIAYVVVSVLTLTRIRRPTFPRDLIMYDRAVGSFTAIAGTCILGSQFVIFGVSTVVATELFAVGGCLWLVLVYAVFTGLSVRDVDEPIDEAIDGSWLLLVVATQSVAMLSGLLAPVYPSVIQELLFAALMLFLARGMFYLILITLVFYRMTFFPVDPGAASPTYWINTGAVAITMLVGRATCGWRRVLGGLRRAPAVFCGLYAFLLDCGDLVDPASHHCRHLATHRWWVRASSHSRGLRSGLLGAGLSTGDVRG